MIVPTPSVVPRMLSQMRLAHAWITNPIFMEPEFNKYRPTVGVNLAAVIEQAERDLEVWA